jgi:hypothetical protein
MIAKEIYYVYDQATSKHKWQIVGSGDDMDYVKNLIAVECKKFKDWDKRKDFPHSKIGVIIENDEYVQELRGKHDTLRPTHKMILDFGKENILQSCEYELDAFIEKKTLGNLNEFWDCITHKWDL